MFDITVVNTGKKNRIVKCLETFLFYALLELACCHHVYELVCSAVCVFVFGKSIRTKHKKTTAPYKPLFKKLCSAWIDINTDLENLKVLDTKNLPRTLLLYIEEAKQVLKV